MTEMARALLEVYPTMALDQYESHEFYGKKVKTLSLVCEQASDKRGQEKSFSRILFSVLAGSLLAGDLRP